MHFWGTLYLYLDEQAQQQNKDGSSCGALEN